MDVPAQDTDFEGSWHVESWVDQPDGLSFVVTLNRYLPIWTYDVYEYYFNDFRWSPSRYCPDVQVRGYFRNETGRGLDSDDEAIEIIEYDCVTY